MPLKDLTSSVLTTSFTIALFTAGLGFSAASQAYAPVTVAANQASEAVCNTSECEAEIRRIRGVNCEDTGNCVVNKPSSEATSISDVVGNN